MKKIIAIIIASVQLSLFLPATVLALKASNQESSSDLGTSQYDSQSAKPINTNQTGGLQNPSGVQSSPNSSLQILSSTTGGSLKVAQQETQPKLAVTAKHEVRNTIETPGKPGTSLKTNFLRILIIIILVILGIRLYRFSKIRNQPIPEPLPEPVKSVVKKPKNKKKKKNVGRRRR